MSLIFGEYFKIDFEKLKILIKISNHTSMYLYMYIDCDIQ